MSDVAIRAHHLGKRYRIGGKQEKYATLRDTIVDIAASPYRRIRGLLRGEAAGGLTEEIWALNDINFEVKHGEVVGIIGRNGAGKSTLLKILSRITEPTTGYADVYGRVGALLEVGTGFHPELTGRENIFLNGAILGMSRDEINRKFDEIVDFAGVDKFIDTPVKHFSSGMGLRLGFAVAAHLEPEILIVDEVLAVGDAEFQKKCLGKMDEVAGEGRTVLFVSHNIAAITQLCTRCLLLQSGTVISDGSPEKVVNAYLSTGRFQIESTTLAERVDREGTGDVRLTGLSIVDDNLVPVSEIRSGGSASFLITYQSINYQPVSRAEVNLRVEDSLGRYLFTASTRFTATDFGMMPGQGTIVCKISSVPLVQDDYSVYISIYIQGNRTDSVHNAMTFRVIDSNVLGAGKSPTTKKHGPFVVAHDWELISERPNPVQDQSSLIDNLRNEGARL